MKFMHSKAITIQFYVRSNDRKEVVGKRQHDPANEYMESKTVGFSSSPSRSVDNNPPPMFDLTGCEDASLQTFEQPV